jgi:hypothetical protein
VRAGRVPAPEPEVLKAASEIRTVGVIVGPYRNLTTLTASILSLHPACVVLNHARSRVLQGRADFIKRQTDESLTHFSAKALSACGSGQRGEYGGSIRFSHAFDRPALAHRYDARFGSQDMTERTATSLIWKESQDVTTRLRSRRVDPGRLLESMPRLRLILPVRHPLDCAHSNVKTGHAWRIPGVDPRDALDVMDGILREFAWFERLSEAHPSQTYIYFQDDAADGVSEGLGRLLDLPDDDQWRDDVSAAYEVSGTKYSYGERAIDAFHRSLERHFAPRSSMAERLRRMVAAAETAHEVAAR